MFVVVNSCLPFFELGRLAGVAFVVPIVNYQWPSLPESVLKDDERKKWYKRMTLVARYAPKLLHWWMIRKTSQSSSNGGAKPRYFTDKDLELLKNAPGFQFLTAVRSITLTTSQSQASRVRLTISSKI